MTTLVVTGLVVVGLAVTGTSAWAQRPPVQSQQLPPLQQRQWQQQGVAPVPQDQASPANPGQGGQDDMQAPTAVQPGQPPAVVEQPNIWVPAKAARLQALDKVNALATALTIKVGQSAPLGSLTITVKACMIRPPGQPADAAAYLDVTDSHADSPGFKGWMLQTEPSVSMMQHPIYDLRVTGCT